MSGIAPASTSYRLSFIDVLRGIAVLLMIETHVVNAMMQEVFKDGFIFKAFNLLSGFASVGFIFCAGAGFWLAIERKGEDYRAFKTPLWQYLRRLAFIFAMAYLIHLPVFSLEKTLQLEPDMMRRFLECNVLQLIVTASLLVLFFFFIIPRLNVLKYVYLILALLIFCLTPFIWSLDPFKTFPFAVALFFTKQGMSAFPLFPWSGYLFAGAAFTAFFLKAEDRTQFAKRAAIISFAGIFVCLYVIRLLPWSLPGYNDWWFSSPGHALFRTSGTIFFFSILYIFQEKIASFKAGQFLQSAGQESLFIYIFHLMLVYGSVLNFGLNAFLKDQLTPLTTIIVIAAITWASYAMAIMWKNYKQQDISRARRLMLALATVFFLGYALVPAKQFTAINDAFKEKVPQLKLF
ncbi:MAG: heparan-alpha-glucosaminide N-acetyltransferase domain-containing protein [Bacteroidota bacterium]